MSRPETPQAPTVRLGPVPQIPLPAQPAIEEDEATQIRSLIARLAEIDKPDFGLSQTLAGHSFAPVAGSEQVGMALFTHHAIQPSPSLRELVERGPRALPFLLAALDDQTPTRLTVGRMMGQWFGREVWGNPVNPIEKPILGSAPPRSGLHDGEYFEGDYTIKVGDVCFVAVGQIVGRRYQAVRYQPSMCLVVNSPTHDPGLCGRVGAVWARDHPARHLFASLLFDYATEGIYNGRSLDGWDRGSTFQCGAAMRLLFYFPRESTEMIAWRLRHLIVSSTHKSIDALLRREVANGVRTADFVRAVSWCPELAIRVEVLRIFQCADDPNVCLAALPGIGRSDINLICTRLEEWINRLPTPWGGCSGDVFPVLVALGERGDGRAKATFRRYPEGGGLSRFYRPIKKEEVKRRLTLCHVLRRTRAEWAVELLGPLLVDRRPSEGLAYPVCPGPSGPRLPVRVCDAAAETIALCRPDLAFQLSGDHAGLDRQIEAMRERIAAEGG